MDVYCLDIYCEHCAEKIGVMVHPATVRISRLVEIYCVRCHKDVLASEQEETGVSEDRAFGSFSEDDEIWWDNEMGG